MTIAFHKNSQQILGINTFGIRLRHDIFDRWLTEKRTIDHVLEHLADANFDPEFYRNYERDIVGKFNSDFGKSIKPKKKRLKHIFQTS
jgi:hypothetical protein